LSRIELANANKAAAAKERAARIAQNASNASSGYTRTGGGVLGRATVGGALGAATSNLSGFIPGIGGGFAMMNLNRVSQELQAQRLAMGAVTALPTNTPEQNEAAGTEQIQWVRDLADQVGFDFRATTPAYTKMLASGTSAGMTTDSVQNIFGGVLKYARVMGSSTDDTKGGMRAIEQMMNKGQVMSEELKGQLAERIPGVVSAMAEAAGFGTGDDAAAKLFKAMEAGTVRSADVLEEFARILEERANAGGALEKAQKTTAAEQQRFNNSVSIMVEQMSAAGSDSGFAKMFLSMSKFLKDNTKLINALGVTINKLGDLMTETGIHLTNLIDGFDRLGDSLGIGGTNLGLFAAGALVLATHFGRIAAALGLFLLVLEDIAVGLKGGDSYTKDFLDFINDNAWAEIGVKSAVFAAGLGLIAVNLMRIAKGIAAVSAVGGGGGMVGGLLSLIAKHPVIAALVAATVALNVAHSVYASKADEHLKKVVENADLPTKTGINQLREKVTLDNIARNNPDFFRDYPSGILPGINDPIKQKTAMQLMLDSLVKKSVSDTVGGVVFNDGAFNITFNGTPEQMMGSGEFEPWLRQVMDANMHFKGESE